MDNLKIENKINLLKFNKMNKLEFTNKVLDNLNESIHKDGKVGLAKFIELTNKLYEDINYTSCCTQILCVDKWHYNDLTKDNKYKVITEDDEYYTIVNDWGEICKKDKDLFELIEK